MYLVFGAFILKPLLYISNVNSNIWNTLNYRNILNFFIKITLLLLNTLKSYIK
jgi:hypothetical protein